MRKAERTGEDNEDPEKNKPSVIYRNKRHPSGKWDKIQNKRKNREKKRYIQERKSTKAKVNASKPDMQKNSENLETHSSESD